MTHRNPDRRRTRAEMSPEELEAARRRANYRDKMKALGRPVNVPAAPVLEYVRFLESKGMSKGAIADAAGLHVSTVVSAATRPPNKVHPRMMRRTTAAKIMAVQYVRPTGDSGPGSLGAKVPSHGVQRRIQALVAAGYPYLWLAGQLGYGTKVECARQFATRPQYKWAHYLTHERVARLYDEIQYDKPSEHGITQYGESRAKRAALDGGFPGPGCWDEDTIDDPDAIPEWTGYCGKNRGYRIHLREGIPVCEPCRVAHREKRARGYRQIDAGKLTAAREAIGMSRRQLSILIGVDSAAVTHWERGRSQPKQDSIDALHDVLGLEDDALYGHEEEDDDAP